MLRQIFFILACLFIVSCGRVANPPGYNFPVPAHHPVTEAPSGRAEMYPWENWPLELDLHGVEITNFYVLRGDEALYQGRRDVALTFYLQALNRSIESSLREAVVLRIASCQLAIDQPASALRTIGDYFKSQGKDESNVDPRFSVILGYAYGRKQDYEQSLAWFSRTDRIAGNSIGIRRSALHGASLLLRAIPDPKLEEFTERWQADPFVLAQIAAEKRRRTSLGINVGSSTLKRPFWDLEQGTAETGALVQQPADSRAQFTIGVLLPLSGKFATLGKSTKNGIELALASAPGGPKVRAVYKDSSGDVDIAIRELGNLLEVEKIDVLIGPLLSEVASAVLPLAEERHVPVVTFSKRDDLKLGETMFRLGATIDSQVESLLSAARQTLGMTRLGVVYPQSADGLEYSAAFRRKAYELGSEVVYDMPYQPGDTQSFSRIAKDLEAQRLEGLFFPDSLDRAAIFFSVLSPQIKSKMKIMGPASWDNPTLLANSRAVLDGAVFVSPFFQRAATDLVKRFNETYQSRYQNKPDFLAAQGFDAATMVLASMRRQTDEGVAFLESFKAISGYNGLTGAIEIGSSGEIQRHFTVVALRDGALQPIWPSTSVDGAGSAISTAQKRS